MSKMIGVSDYHKEAAKILQKSDYNYFAAVASTGETFLKNSKALKKWFIRPRAMRDVSETSTGTLFMGIPVSAPIGISPTAFHTLAHPEGECSTAKAANALNLPYVMSFFSTRALEEVASVAPSGVHLLQISPFKDRELSLNMFRRVEQAGFKGLVLTVDSPVYGVRYSVEGGYLRPTKIKMAHIDIDSNQKMGAAFPYIDASASWDYVKWVKSVTRLPLILKGILTREDAESALEAGADAIWVSNHGGRQLDGVMPTIEALLEVVSAVKKRIPVYVDSGFRSGSDVFKALALGADMVFLGRPVIWGLASKGEEGVKGVLNLIKMELQSALALTGCSSVRSIRKELVVRAYPSSL